ncbi:hypothetical protein Vafri_5227 [Volvox africanus]|uniref:Uncharacterized protein n=1 Tax=Volvox africanus TaxID=51714 RepID=A0A8J4AY12_9CHLO|nr:hypothetical protein Vafri_5227 [Volvox africanus]
MKRDRHSVVLASSLAQAVAAPRGHRSLGDGENLALGAGRRSGSLHDRTNINSRGWNNSTKTSPTLKRRIQENKENSKLPGIRKFQHVQSKLTAPVFAQRRLKHADGTDKAETAPGGGPLAPFSDVPRPTPQADDPGNADEPQGPVKSVPFDHFVTKRCRGQQAFDAHCDIDFNSPRSHVHVDDRVPALKQAEMSTNLPVVSPLARASPHPSVSALYQYAQEVRTPLSSAADAPSSCDRSVDNDNMSRGSKGAAHRVDQARSEDLTDSFGTWLASMSMQPEALPPVALGKMHALWMKAKEAVQLQVLVEQLQNVELEQNVTENFELYGTSQIPANNCLEGGEANLQQHLLDAQEHLVCLTQVQTSPGNSQAPLGDEAPSSDDPGATYLEAEVGTLVAAASPVAESSGQACSLVCSTGSVVISAQASDRAWECCETPTAARFMEGGAMGMQLDFNPSDASGLKHADYGSFQDLPGSQIQPCCSSASAALATTRTELESPYSCARFAIVAPCGPAETPGLSVISRAPEAVPFATWAAGVDGAACPVESPSVRLNPMEVDSASVATPEGTMPSPGVMPSPHEVDSGLIAPQSHQQSAGLSFASRMPQPVAFAMWATHRKLDQTPGAASDCYGPRSDCAGSPQQSAGLSVISSIPQAVAFDVWESVRRAHLTRSAGGNMQSTPSPYRSMSPLSSVGPETVSKPEPAGSWNNSAASTPFMGLGTNVERASPATHVLCNPLFEIDSPASSISVLPERADALGGLAPTPSPARMVSPPSLASTPLSAFSQGLHSNLTSPVGECSPVLFNGKALAAADSSASAVTTPGSCVVTVIDTSSNTNIGEPEPAAEAVCAEKLSGSVDDVGSRDESPLQAEMSFPGAATNTADGDPSISPSSDDVPRPESYAMPEAEVPAAALVESCRADCLSPKDVLSPAAENVITTKFAASPVADFHVRESTCMETHLAVRSAKLAVVDTEAVDLQQGPSVEITQGVPAVVLSRVASWDQGSPEPGSAVQEPPTGSCSTTRQNGPAKVLQLLGEGTSQSYPNTPSAAWSPSQTTSVYATPLEAFATPTSFASLCSAICLTAMRMRGGPAMASGRGPTSGNGTPSNFTFGLSHVQPDGCGVHMDAPTPTLGPAIPVAADGVNKSNPSLPFGLGFHANAGFGSPLPLMQLSPVQMRVLDHLAGHVIAALSPANKHGAPKDLGSSPVRPRTAQEQSLTGDEGRPSSDAAAAAFSLAQLLADLRSPLPVPGHQRTRLVSTAREETPTASAVEIAPVAKIELGDLEVTSPRTMVSNAQAGVSAADSVHAPSASPMPNFARLMAFLNAASHTATAPVGVGRPSGGQGQLKPALVPLDNEVGGANATTPDFNFTHLLAQLCSPLSNPHAARPDDVASGAGYVDSPITAHGGHDSPASSEAASFGFSTAAKQMASRITPSTTPGGLSFVRWAHDAGPPSFRLDNDAPRARGRAARTPSTPVSFSFGAPFGPMPTNEDVTPVVGNGRPKDMRAAHGPSPTKLHLHPVPTVTGGGQVQSPCAAAQPEVGRQATNESFSFHAVAANPEVSNGNTVASSAFSFGSQSGDLLGCAATSMAAFGIVQDRSLVGCGELDAAQSAVRCSLRGVAGSLARQSSWNPAPSLGNWGSKPRGSDASASPLSTPSARGFTFNHVVASLMATPIWPGAGTTAAELAAERPEASLVSDLSAAFQQFAVAVSPTLFGLATNGDPQDAPGVDSQDVCYANVTHNTCDGSEGAVQGAGAASLQEDAYAPAAAFLWATLLGNLQSPVPAAIQARHQHPGPKPPPTATSEGTLPAKADVLEPSSTGFISGSAAVAEAATAPPPYEDLPDLIARGLCLSASTTVQPLDEGLITAEPDSCSVLGKDSTPSGCSTIDCLFHPVHKLIPAATPGTLDDSPVVTLQSPTGQVVIKSVSDSNRGSSDTLYAAPTAKTTCTTGPAPTSPTRDPQAIDRTAAANVDGNSSHNSPVFSFHVASEGSARSVDSAQAFLPLIVTTKSAEACSGSIIVGDAGASTPGATSHVVGRCEDDIDGQQGSPAGSVSPEDEESTASMVDAMPRVLSSAGAISMTTESRQDMAAVAAVSPSGAIELSKDHSTAGSSHIPSVPVPSPVTCKRQDVLEGLVSPLTFSYLSSGTPPSTPPTAELASSGKGGSVAGQPRASPRASTGSSSHFWAPSPSGPSAASGERVTLEASNRRIRTNADLLLDFQGSPAHVAPTVPIASVTGAVTPRIKGVPFAWHGAHAPLHVSPLRKSWDAALNSNIQPLTHVTAAMQNASASAVFPVAPGDVLKLSSKPKDSSVAGCGILATRATATNPNDSQTFATASVAVGRNSGGMAQAGLRPRTIQPGQGPPLQQLVATGIEQALASATAAVVQHSSGLPLSHRLGLWPAAAWGIPCNPPADAVTLLPSALVSDPSAKAAQGLQHEGVMQANAGARSPTKQGAPPGKPVVTSRDVQTTPGLIKMHRDYEHKETAAQPLQALVDKSVPLPCDRRIGQVSVGTGSVAVNRKPAYRSRIPMPGGATRASAATKVTTQVSCASTAASSDGEESNPGMSRTPPERLLRRRRLLSCSAAAGGPQRVLVKRGTQRASVQDAADIAMGLGEEEVRRRARVLGMRISPYLRTKPSKVRPLEAPKPSKG